MFKTTKDFDNEVYKFLVKIRDGEDWQTKPDNLEKVEFADIREHAVNTGLIIVDPSRGRMMDDSYFISGEPRLTRSGLVFIESFRD